ncbi:hypothetical protein E4T42_07805, partial [Aureobasidium subglaciale]
SATTEDFIYLRVDHSLSLPTTQQQQQQQQQQQKQQQQQHQDHHHHQQQQCLPLNPLTNHSPTSTPKTILWCTPTATIKVKQYLASKPENFLGSFLNQCIKTVDLWRDHWRMKDTGGLIQSQIDVVEHCLRTWPISPDALISNMQHYHDEKFVNGATLKGVVNMRKGPPTEQAIMNGTTQLYNKIYSIGERELHRKQLERNAGLTPIERPHPGLDRVRTNRQAGTERRKKRKFGDEEEGLDAWDSMRKMKKGLPTLALGAEDEIKVEGKKHEELVFSAKGKGKEKVEETVKEKDNEE